jgi:cytochrome c oxidase subunit 2
MDDAIRKLLQLPPRGSSAAPSLDHLHFVVIGLAVVVAFVTFGLLAYFFVRYRDRPGTPRAQPLAPSNKPELVLSSITLAVFMALWVVGFSQLRAMRSPPRDAMQIYVVAKQWMWSFVYPDGSSAQDELRVPVGQPVELLLTSRDVIHSFYVPAFREKQDAVPGRMTSLDFTAAAPGTYPILCAEYCGAGHSRMRGKVIALAPDDYARWLATHPATDLAAGGARVAAEHGCLRCHNVPRVAPPLVGIYGTSVPLVGGGTATVDPAYITESIMDPAAKVHAGYVPTMPSYLGQLSAADTAAIVEYIREAKP